MRDGAKLPQGLVESSEGGVKSANIETIAEPDANAVRSKEECNVDVLRPRKKSRSNALPGRSRKSFNEPTRRASLNNANSDDDFQ